MNNDPNEHELLRRKERFEFWEQAAAWVLIFGLAVEVGVILYEQPLWPNAARDLTGSFLVLAGVVGETLWGGRAGKISETLRQLSELKVAEANARAEEASLELARLKAPRMLALDQATRVANKMSDFVGRRVTIGASPEAFDSMSLVHQITAALEMAGLTVQIWNAGVKAHVGLARTIVIKYTTGNARGEALANTLMHALVAEGIPAGTVPGLQEEAAATAGTGGHSRNDPGLEWVVIAVGEKT